MFIRKIIVLLFLCLCKLLTYAQAKNSDGSKLLVILHNAPFQDLCLVDYKDETNIYINGEKIGKNKWEFTIKDEVVEKSEYMMLFVPSKDTLTKSYQQIRFLRTFRDNKTSLVNIGIQNKFNYIEAEYKGRVYYENENISKFSNDKSATIGGLISNDFELIINEDTSDVAVRSMEPNFAWFTNYSGKEKLTYDDYLQSYISLSKKHPNSRYLLTYLALNLYNFKSRNDVKKIYENLSPLQESLKWTKKIDLFLSGDFVNTSLVNLETKRLEEVVQDTQKYNLITFSASWCVPCIEEIPILKALYNDIRATTNFTYISIDNQKDIYSFQSLMKKNNIPWRSLYAYRDLEKIKDLYSVLTIPYTILIFPNGKVEQFDIRNVDSQVKLKSLVSKVFIR